MKRLLRWLGIGLGILVGLLIVVYAVTFVLSWRVLRHAYEIPRVALTVPTDPASIAEGRRLATVHGCLGACHGKQGEGSLMIDEPMMARIVAPDLTAAVRNYSAAELAAIVRNGVRPDGTSLLVMPSEVFAPLTDQDLGAVVAYFKSVPPAAGPGRRISLGPIGQFAVGVGMAPLAAQLIAKALPPPEATTAEAVRGRYLARTICAGCHGTNLRGASEQSTSPDLRIVAAYPPEAFTQLLRTGVALGERKLTGEMGEIARNNLHLLTDAEIADLYSYLHTLPEAAPAPAS